MAEIAVLPNGDVLTIRAVSYTHLVKEGGFGSEILELFNQAGIKADVTILGYPDIPIKHGKREIIMAEYGLTAQDLATTALEVLAHEKEA